MQKKIAILGIIVILLVVGLSGCTTNLPDTYSNIITITISSDYDYDAGGSIAVDGEYYCYAYSNANIERTYEIDKNLISNATNKHTITLILTSGGVEQTASACNVSEFVEFHVTGVGRMAEYGWTEDHYISVTDTDGNYCDIDIHEGEPTALATADVTTGMVPLTVSFNGLGNDTDGSIVSYEWDFGDGEKSSEQNPTHIFTDEGSYTVELTVTDNDGNKAEYTVKIKAEYPEPIVLSQGVYSDSWENHIVGEIENIGSKSIEFVKVKVTLYDASNNIISSETVDPFIEVIGAGETSTYQASFYNDYYHHYEVIIQSYRTTNDLPYSGLKVKNHNMETTEYGGIQVDGEIENTGSIEASLTDVYVIFYSSSGDILKIDSDFIGTVYSGETESFGAYVSTYEVENLPSSISDYSIELSFSSWDW